MTARVQRMASPLAAGALAAVGVLALHLRDPHVSGSWGICPFLAVTGWDCPLCGGLRGVHDLTHLEWSAAASSNLLLIVLVPLALAFWGRRIVATWRGGEAMRPLQVPTSVWVVGLGLVTLFTVARNLPGSWLAA